MLDHPKPCRVLTLDGGGAKGFYTLGVLSQLEALLGREPLCGKFDLIYGTSTGAIIAALLALGKSVTEIRALYQAHVPRIMGAKLASTRTRELEALACSVFKNATFSEVKTPLAIVATRWNEERPLIFKSHLDQAHGSSATFVPGFGCKIADAVVASCSAYPFFERRAVTTSDGSIIEALDGGYCANNPTLYAIADATLALAKLKEDLRVVSIGVGVYPEPPRYGHKWLIWRFFLVRLLQKTLNINTHSMETLSGLLFKDVPMVRINDTYSTPEMATDLMERDPAKLNLLYQRGGESFGRYESSLKQLLDVT